MWEEMDDEDSDNGNRELLHTITFTNTDLRVFKKGTCCKSHVVGNNSQQQTYEPEL